MKKILILFYILLFTISCQKKMDEMTTARLSLYFIELGYYNIDRVKDIDGNVIKYMYETGNIIKKDRLIFTQSLLNSGKILVVHEIEYLATGKTKKLWEDSVIIYGDEESENQAKEKINKLIEKFNDNL
ncbi:hypothetical protein [Brachyspira pilosicoli]|uniref:hypothetical protein n=1 Tax=Brachyspira pilosicoli TaxID=52584 RepID=UPI0012F4E423|nr:hypothetical protein [Brachyspira pilosicoli]